MPESKQPSNFIGPQSIDNLSIAGVSVWLICITTASLVIELESFWIRIVAMSISVIWSFSLFVKNKRWNKPSNYILVLVNAVLIYTNAAGLNTVIKQSPFEGYGVKTDLKDIKDPVVQMGFFNSRLQKNWNPDYELLRYIDTLKQKGVLDNMENKQLKNQFSYIRDNIDKITDDRKAKETVKNYLKDFGKPNIDSSDFAIMKNEYQMKIDSLLKELQYQKDHPRTATTYYTVNGKDISAEDMVRQNFIKISDLENKNLNLIGLINFIKNQTSVPKTTIDTVMKRIGY